jgi:AraC-like DNA-binding protein
MVQAASVRLVSPRGLAGVLVTSVDNSDHCWRSFHEGYTVATVLPPSDGGLSEGRVKYRTWEYTTAPGSLMLMEPGELHVTQHIAGLARFRLLQLAPDRMARAADELGLRTPIHWRMPIAADPALYAEFTAFHSFVERDASAEVLEAQLVKAVGMLLLACAETRPHDAIYAHGRREVERALDYLRANYRDRIHLDELSRHCGVTRFRIDQLFTRAVGVSPLQYQRELRLSEARRLLSRGWRPAKVASEVGFYDHSQFCRYFRDSVALSPKQYADGAI